MTGPEGWLRKCREELDELEVKHRGHNLRGADAYRYLVLSARLRQAPNLGEPADRFPGPADLEEMSRQCTLPDAQEVLDALLEALDSEEEVAGKPHDTLLDADDLASVLALLGRGHEAHDLAARSGALAALHPTRVVGLYGWAEMRWSTLKADAPSRLLWQAITEVPAEALVDMLPTQESRSLTLAEERTLRRLKEGAGQAGPRHTTAPARRWPRVQAPPLAQAAAHSLEPNQLPALTSDGEKVGMWYVDPESNERRLDLRLPSADVSTPTAIWLDLVDKRSAATVASEPLTFTREGRDLYITLGPDVGPKSVAHRLVAKAVIPDEFIELLVRIDET